jgi:hypothetical protein
MERPYRSQNEDFAIMITCSLLLISYFLFLISYFLISYVVFALRFKSKVSPKKPEGALSEIIYRTDIN